MGAVLYAFAPDLSSASAVGFAGTSTATGGGVKIDTSGGDGNHLLNMSGSIDGNILLAQTPTSDITQLVGVTLSFADSNGNPIPTSGQDVGTLPGGTVFVAATTAIFANGDNIPGIVSFDAVAGTGTFGGFQSPGVGGFAYGLDVDASGNVALGFTFNNPAPPPAVKLAGAAEFDVSGNLIGGVGFSFVDANNNPLSGYGYGAALDATAPGVVLLSRVGGDLSVGGGNMGFTTLDVANVNIIDDQGHAYGDNDDQGRELAFDSVNRTMQIAGETNSPIFKDDADNHDIGAGHAQPANSGAGYNGIVTQYGNL